MSSSNIFLTNSFNNIANVDLDYTMNLIKREIEYIFEYYPETYIDLEIRPKIKKDFDKLLEKDRSEVSLEGLSLIMDVFNQTGFFCDEGGDILL